MSALGLLSLIGIVVVIVLMGRMLRGGPAGEDDEDADEAAAMPSLPWKFFVNLLCVLCGAWAVREYWHHLPKGEAGMGGVAYMIVAIPVFMLGAIAAGALFDIGERLSDGRLRLPIAALLTIGLIFGFFQPIRHQAQRAERQARFDAEAAFEANLKSNQKLMETVAHAPPGAVPEMLKAVRDGNGVDITNVGSERLRVSLRLIVPRGRQWERCWLSVRVPNCSSVESGCAYQLGKDGSQIPLETDSGVTQPLFEPGQTRRFEISCEDRFEAAPLEFDVSEAPLNFGRPSSAPERLLFRSDSAFVPDYPKLW